MMRRWVSLAGWWRRWTERAGHWGEEDENELDMRLVHIALTRFTKV